MAESIYRVLALRVREERRRAELTLEQLGERAGITGAFVAHIEAGRKRPTLNTIEKLAHALDTSVAALLASQRDGVTADADHIHRFARCIAPLSRKQKDALLKLMRLGAELLKR